MSPRDEFDPFAPTRPRRRLTLLGRLIAYGIGGGVLVAGAAGATLWFWRPQPHMPALLRPDTHAIVQLRPTVRALVGLPMLRRAYPEAFRWNGSQEQRRWLEHELGLIVEQDVLPWVGVEAGMAFVGSRAGAVDAGGVVALAARDEAGARAAIAKIVATRKLRGDQVLERSHEGASYWLIRPTVKEEWALGLVDGMVVATTGEGVFWDVLLRAARKGETLADDPDYRALDAELPRDAVFTGYLAGGEDFAALARAMTDRDPRGTKELAAWLEAFRGAGFGVAMRSQGVEVTAIGAVDPGKLPEESRRTLAEAMAPIDPNLLARAPADTIAGFSFRFPEAARDVLSEAWRRNKHEYPLLGFDPERDLLAWLPGDLAIAATPGAGELPAGAYLALRPTRPELAEEALARMALASGASEDGGWRVVRKPGEEAGIAAFRKDGADVRLALGSGVVANVKQGGPTLVTAERYRIVSSHLPRPNSGMLYVDVDGIKQILRANPAIVPTHVPDQLATVHALGGASTPGLSAEGFFRSTLFVAISEPTPP